MTATLPALARPSGTPARVRADAAAPRRRHLLGLLYDAATADAVAESLAGLLAEGLRSTPTGPLDETDAWLVAHPDDVVDATGQRTPLATLADLVDAHLSHAVSGVHTLPLHPPGSDGGSAVMEHGRVDEALGTPADLRRLAAGGTWVADAVVGRVPAQGPWSTAWPAGDRTVGAGTTVSPGQVDLDLREPRVLLAMVQVLLGYVALGARGIHLSGVGSAWEDPATRTLDLPGTHHVVQLLRACLDAVDPGLVLVTGTDVPDEENVVYLGLDGEREAQAVYQLALPALTLHAFVSGDAGPFKRWARGLWFPGDGRTYLNVLAGHGGTGVRAVAGLLADAAVDRLVEVTRGAGGVVDERTPGDGGQRPYELAVTWAAVLGHGHDEQVALRRHLSSHALALALRGVPLLHLGSLVAAGDDERTCAATPHGRDLDRRRWDAAELDERLATPGSREQAALSGISAMLHVRRAHAAFSPDAEQVVHGRHPALVVVERLPDEGCRAAVAVNVSGSPVPLELPAGRWARIDAGADLPGSAAAAGDALEAYGNAWFVEVR